MSEQMPGPRHVSRTCQPVEQSWKVPGPFPVLRSLPKGGAQGAQEGQMDVLEAASGLLPGRWKGKANSCQERDMTCFSVFFFSNLVCMFQRREARGVEAWLCWRERE